MPVQSFVALDFIRKLWITLLNHANFRIFKNFDQGLVKKINFLIWQNMLEIFKFTFLNFLKGHIINYYYYLLYYNTMNFF